MGSKRQVALTHKREVWGYVLSAGARGRDGAKREYAALSCD